MPTSSDLLNWFKGLCHPFLHQPLPERWHSVVKNPQQTPLHSTCSLPAERHTHTHTHTHRTLARTFSNVLHNTAIPSRGKLLSQLRMTKEEKINKETGTLLSHRLWRENLSSLPGCRAPPGSSGWWHWGPCRPSRTRAAWRSWEMNT